LRLYLVRYGDCPGSGGVVRLSISPSQGGDPGFKSRPEHSFTEQAGTKADGSKKWRILNAGDNSEHERKTKEPQKSKETLLAILIGNEAKPILEAIKADKSLHWKDASRDGLTVLELYAP
jgi:hypothetical protein